MRPKNSHPGECHREHQIVCVKADLRKLAGRPDVPTRVATSSGIMLCEAWLTRVQLCRIGSSTNPKKKGVVIQDAKR